MTKACTGPLCDRPRRKLTLCDTHYTQWRTKGDLTPIRQPVTGLPHACDRHAPGRTCYSICGCRCDDCRAGNARDRQLRKMGRLTYADPTGTRRRLQALGALGWSKAAIAAATGVHERQIAQLRSWDRPIWRSTAERVRRGYDALSMRLPPDTPTARRNRTDAARRGWLTPLHWDEGTIDDPAAEPWRPSRYGTRGSTVEDIAWCIEGGETNPEAIAGRVGIAPTSVKDLLRKAGRHDLVARLSDPISVARRAHGRAA